MTKSDNTHLKGNSQEISLINFHQTLTLDIQYHVYNICKLFRAQIKLTFLHRHLKCLSVSKVFFFFFSKLGVYYSSKRFQSSKLHIHLICQGGKRNRETNSFFFLDEFPDCGIATFSSRFCHLIISQKTFKMLPILFWIAQFLTAN